jgi:hypothetical protein
VGSQTLADQIPLREEGVQELGIGVGRKQYMINLSLEPLEGPYAFGNFVIVSGIGSGGRGSRRN